MRIKRLPNVLALHLKRFKYIEHLQRFKKLSYRISFPLELEIPEVRSRCAQPTQSRSALCPRLLRHAPPYVPLPRPLPQVCLTTGSRAEGTPPDTFRLFAVIVHAGSGPNHGHYVALVRSHQHWLCFDDDVVDLVDAAQIQGVRAGHSTSPSFTLCPVTRVLAPCDELSDLACLLAMAPGPWQSLACRLAPRLDLARPRSSSRALPHLALASPWRAQYFGSAQDTAASTETGYLLFYQRESWESDDGGSSVAAGSGPTSPAPHESPPRRGGAHPRPTSP